jgi:hypothetical protein
MMSESFGVVHSMTSVNARSPQTLVITIDSTLLYMFQFSLTFGILFFLALKESSRAGVSALGERWILCIGWCTSGLERCGCFAYHIHPVVLVVIPSRVHLKYSIALNRGIVHFYKQIPANTCRLRAQYILKKNRILSHHFHLGAIIWGDTIGRIGIV